MVAQQAVGIQISILQGSATGTAVYTETHTATTNTNGLVTLTIGAGTTSDDFTAIDWSNGPYFIQTETDPVGGSNYTITATSQLLSVPYALYAQTAGSANQAPATLSSVLQENNSANSQQIKDLADPTEAQDAVTMSYLQASIQQLQNQINNDIDNDYDGFTENQGDCDDTNSEVNPESTEICDGIDNDCDGVIDEGNICNAAPVINAIDITPSNPSTNDDLVCSAFVTDADDDPVTLSYSWYINGTLVGTSNTLSNSNTSFGDSVWCDVTASDGISSVSLTSSIVVIQNTVPVITAVTILPANPTTNDDLTCSATATDADDDPVSFSYSWYIDGVLVGTSSSLSNSNTFVGDWVWCNVTAYDDYSSSISVSSETVVISD